MGGTVAVIIAARKRHLPLRDVADLSGLCLAIGQTIGRIGCQLAGDGDYGRPSSLPWAMSYPDGVVPTLERVHPTPIYEMTLYFLIFVALWLQRGRPRPPGSLFGQYLIACFQCWCHPCFVLHDVNETNLGDTLGDTNG